MALKLTGQYRSRKRIGTVTLKNVPSVGTAIIVELADATNAVEVTFDRAVMLTGFPSTWRVTASFGFNAPVIGAELLSRTVVRLALGVPVIGALAVVTPPFDPAIRTKTGGYAAADGRML